MTSREPEVEPTMTSQKAPDCPYCGHPPFMVLSSQAFCGTEDCPCVMWNPDLTPAQNLVNVTEVDLSGLD